MFEIYLFTRPDPGPTIWSDLLPVATALLGYGLAFATTAFSERAANKREKDKTGERRQAQEEEEVKAAKLALSEIAAELFSMRFSLQRSQTEKLLKQIIRDAQKRGEIHIQKYDPPIYREDVYRANIGSISIFYEEISVDVIGIYNLMREFFPYFGRSINIFKKRYDLSLGDKDKEDEQIAKIVGYYKSQLSHYYSIAAAADHIITRIEEETGIKTKPDWLPNYYMDVGILLTRQDAKE